MRIIAILLSLIVTITGCGMVENPSDSSNESKVINQKLEVIKKDTNDTTNPIDNDSDNEVKNTVEPWESSTSPYTYHCGVEKCPGHLIDYDVVSSSDLPVCEHPTRDKRKLDHLLSMRKLKIPRTSYPRYRRYLQMTILL